MTMENIIVKTKSLKKHYEVGTHTVVALNGVDFEVKEREFVSIIGKSGCGKSTLLHMLGGLDSPTSGSVIVDGINLSEMNQEQLALFRRRKIGFIFQQYNLIPDLNVYDNILFPLELDGVKADKEFVQELLKTLHIADKTEMFPSMLSGGEQQRVAIARALATKPAIILADEPTGALDSKNAKALMEKLLGLNQNTDATILMVTHDAFSASYAGRILFLRDGRIFTEILKGSDSRKAFFEKIRPFSR